MKSIFVLFLAVCSPAQTPNLDFLTNQVDGTGLREMLPKYLKEQVRQKRLTTPASKDVFRARFLQGLGGLPQRTPLNARVVGTVQRDGYKVEKIIFESQPGFYVTANLYLPSIAWASKAPYPAILFPIGHETGAKAYPVWQQILATFARRGYVALTWDQLGQGERVQHWDEGLGGSKAGQATTEHTLLGIQTLLTGDSLAKYTIWDGIRALDYLLSRPEVDPTRIGVTGNSGGGTHTAYLAALDDRIHVAAPSCYITSWQRLLDTIGPQDAEQCIPGFLGAGFEHVDFIRAFAPKPYLVLSAIRDFFSIQGARATYASATEAYVVAEAREKIAMAETDEGHGYSSELRLASYGWFDHWLRNEKPTTSENNIVPAMAQELACTETGQVATALQGETVFTLNRARAQSLRLHAAITQGEFRQRINWHVDETPPTMRPYGKEKFGDLVIEKLVYESEPGVLVPAVLVSQDGPPSRPRAGVLLASSRGKQAAWKEIISLASKGEVVLAIDVRGIGETRPVPATKGGSWTEWFGDYDSAMTSVMLGNSLTVQRAHDIQRGFHLLASRPGMDRRLISGAAQGNAAVALLHAAAAGVPFSKIMLDGMLASYRSVAESPLHRGIFESIVPGALRYYDLPDLVTMMPQTRVLVVDPASPMGATLPQATAESIFRSLRGTTRVISRMIEEPPAAAYLWLIY